MKRILYVGFAVMSTAMANAAALSFQSPVEQTTLVELYTSEGCSSCPPAESWLNGLKESPGLWKDFVPLAFHVDYWDDLGWRDPLAAPGFPSGNAHMRNAGPTGTFIRPALCSTERSGSIGIDERTCRQPERRRACSPSVLRTRTTGRRPLRP